MRLHTIAAALYACSFMVTPSFGQEIFRPTVTVGTGSGERMDTRGYLGFSWNLGAGAPMRPDVVVGVQRIRVKSDDELTGIDLSARFGLDGSLSRIALAGLYGSREVYANAGVGYDFRGKQVIATVGAQTARLRAGLDFGLQARRFMPYFEVNSLGQPDAVSVSASSLSCSGGYVLTNGAGLSGEGTSIYNLIVDSGLDVDGTACIDPSFVV